MAASTGARLQRKAARTAVSAAATLSFLRCYGSCYSSKAFAKACRDLGLKHVRTRPIRRALHLDGAARMGLRHRLPDIDYRAAELPVWLHRYNWHRPHGSLKSKTPISRLALTEDNLLSLHI